LEKVEGINNFFKLNNMMGFEVAKKGKNKKRDEVRNEGGLKEYEQRIMAEAKSALLSFFADEKKIVEIMTILEKNIDQYRDSWGKNLAMAKNAEATEYICAADFLEKGISEIKFDSFQDENAVKKSISFLKRKAVNLVQ
jgi:hypothetical protein